MGYAQGVCQDRCQPTTYCTIFTLCLTYIVTITTSYYDPNIILSAGVLTAGVVGALTAYAMTTKTDFTMMGGLLWVFGIVLLLFIPLFFVFSQAMYTVYCAFG